jgi:cell division protein FtsA
MKKGGEAMAKVFSGSMITSIDIGTTKICVMIARRLSEERVEIVGVGNSPSHGLERGVVVDIAKTVQSIRNAVAEAQLMADYEIVEAIIGISGSHIQSFNSSGAVPIKRGAIGDDDVAAVLESAQAVSIEQGQKVLHVLPQYFVVDGNRVDQPLGLHGIRLEAVVHVITGAISSIQNLVTCCESAGIKVCDIVLEQLASAAGVLSRDEKILGVGVLDIGGGTSDFAIYQSGSIRYTRVFPIAGNMFTRDLAVGLRATIQDAERVKCNYGSVFLDQQAEEIIDIETVQGNIQEQTSRGEITYILQARAQELLLLLDHELEKSDLKNMMIAGLVITGGGSLLKGIDELAKNILSLPVRIGRPQTEDMLPDSLKSPKYATGFGLLKYALQMSKKHSMMNMEGTLATRVLMRVRSWVADFF